MQPNEPNVVPEPSPRTVRNPETGLLTTDPAECEPKSKPEPVESPEAQE